MQVGNVNSNERGSGARFNAGKVRLDYVTAEVLHDFYVNCPVPMPVYEDDAERAMAVLNSVADFEERRGDEEDERALAFALDAALDREQGVNRWRSCCDVFDFGAKKYAPWNWAKGMAWSIPLACIKRHAVKILEGEILDDESGHSHFGHIACNLVMLLHYWGNFAEGDDRPSRECFAVEQEREMLRACEQAWQGSLPTRGLCPPSRTIVSPETGDTVEVDSCSCVGRCAPICSPRR